MDQDVRNALRNAVTRCRQLLEEATAETLQGHFGIYSSGRSRAVEIEDDSRMGHLSEEDVACRTDLLDHLRHIEARDLKPTEALAQLVREISFTHLNRLCAYKMMEARGLIREAVSRGADSQGFFFYLADHPEDERLHSTGQQDLAYRHYLDWLGGQLSQEIGVLFEPSDSANRVYPPQRVLDETLELLNSDELSDIWAQDETIGWVYQYFTPKELRDEARRQSQAPRNSYELAFRNQFYTPRYVVEFLTDNTLGRTWYEMRKGDTRLSEECQYLVRRPIEVFLAEGESRPAEDADSGDLSQEELLRRPEYIEHRAKKDPREIWILDPACGSGHFLLYCFDLLEVIYEEAYVDPDVGRALRTDYTTLDELRSALPGLILRHNLHGVDIDLRATQIASLALWLRCQRASGDLDLATDERPRITRSNVVCAEPMPGEDDLLAEFTATLQPALLGQLVTTVFEKMKLAGELGSLLEMEDEIREAVADAKREYAAHLQRLRDDDGYLPTLEPPRERTLFDFADMTETDFLDRAEDDIVAALGEYATRGHAGARLRRALFADDAAHGFAFVDLCRRRYDVVLMNPPFGEPSLPGKAHVRRRYRRTSGDVFQAFVERGLSLLVARGQLGVLSARTGFFLGNSESWRIDVVFQHRLACFADLGLGVLDAALVEVAAYVVSRESSYAARVFVNRQLATQDKQRGLADAIASLPRGLDADTFLVSQDAIAAVPGHVFAYWAPQSLLRRYGTRQRFGEVVARVRQGIATADDFRFVRLAWEVEPTQVGAGRPWVRFSKGGEYSPFYDDVHLVVRWQENGRELKAFPGCYVRNEGYYFRPGATYTVRTASAFAAKVLPADCIFSHNAQSWFPQSRSDSLVSIAFMSTRVAQAFLELSVGGGDVATAGSAARRYTTAVVQGIPADALASMDTDQCRDLASGLTAHRFGESGRIETSCLFSVFAIATRESSLQRSAHVRAREALDATARALQMSADLDVETRRLFSLSSEEEAFIDGEIGPHPATYAAEPDAREVTRLLAAPLDKVMQAGAQTLGSKRWVTKKSYFVDRRIELIAHILKGSPYRIIEIAKETNAAVDVRTFAQHAVSECVGVVLGRWDILRASDPSLTVCREDHFDALPSVPPGMLIDAAGPQTESASVASAGSPIAARVPDSQEPQAAQRSGALADDPLSADDVVDRVRGVLDVAWPGRADAIESEVCAALDVRSLREYFRKTVGVGFWPDHVQRYSKSRRKAPIYWYLRSSKGNYGLWLYYHHLDKDTLFRALQNYVEPKIQLEENRLSSLRSQQADLGSAGRAAKQVERDIDRQEQLLSELYDFRDKLRRAAALRIDPNLNDGVVLNIAPLWELVPWKEAKKHWDALEAGKYDWSHIAYQLWPGRVEELCRTDRSVAIAHGREDLWQANP
jgi:hypothetical protein